MSLEEGQAMAKEIAMKRLFMALDQNADGVVDAEEYLAFLRIGLGLSSATLRHAEEAMGFKDLSCDGLLSIDELREACADLDAAAICRLCEPLEREAQLEVYQMVQVEPPQGCNGDLQPSPWAATRCTGFCASFPAAENHELVVTARDAAVEPVGLRPKTKAWPPSKWRDERACN